MMLHDMKLNGGAIRKSKIRAALASNMPIGKDWTEDDLFFLLNWFEVNVKQDFKDNLALTVVTYYMKKVMVTLLRTASIRFYRQLAITILQTPLFSSGNASRCSFLMIQLKLRKRKGIVVTIIF